MNNYLFGNVEQFLYGAVCSNEPDESKIFKRNRVEVHIEIESSEITPNAAGNTFPVIAKMPAQTASIKDVLERNLNWSEVLVAIRALWGCSQVEMSKILGISEKTILNIEKNNSQPNTINRKKLFLLKDLTDFLMNTISRKYAIKDLLNAELPALGMMTPKEFLTGGEEASFKELLGTLKRIYK